MASGHQPAKISISTGTSISGGTTCSWSARTRCCPFDLASAIYLVMSIVHAGAAPPLRTGIWMVAALLVTILVLSPTVAPYRRLIIHDRGAAAPVPARVD